MHSCLYTGSVRHRRFEPKLNRFRYSIRLLYLDLDELDDVVRRLPFLRSGRWAVASLRMDERMTCTASNNLGSSTAGGSPCVGLRERVARVVEAETGRVPSGPVRWLTLWGSFGVFFAPVSFYYCFAPDGQTLEAIVAEVSNTPWRERHCYVLHAGNQFEVETESSESESAFPREKPSDERSCLRFRHAKQFHVSPFLDVALDYHWTITAPNESTTIHLEARHRAATHGPARSSECVLDATLRLKREPLTRLRWLRAVARHPLVPIRVLAGIYFEALKLWINKVPFYPHPRKRSVLAPSANEAKIDDDKPALIETER